MSYASNKHHQATLLIANIALCIEDQSHSIQMLSNTVSAARAIFSSSAEAFGASAGLLTPVQLPHFAAAATTWQQPHTSAAQSSSNWGANSWLPELRVHNTAAAGQEAAHWHANRGRRAHPKGSAISNQQKARAGSTLMAEQKRCPTVHCRLASTNSKSHRSKMTDTKEHAPAGLPPRQEEDGRFCVCVWPGMVRLLSQASRKAVHAGGQLLLAASSR